MTSLNPLKEKKQAPARNHKTRRHLARTHPERQPPSDGLKTAKHHLNPGSNLAKNHPPQRAEVTSLNPLKEKKQSVPKSVLRSVPKCSFGTPKREDSSPPYVDRKRHAAYPEQTQSRSFLAMIPTQSNTTSSPR